MEQPREIDKRLRYNEQQIEFVRMLIEKEKCTLNMVSEITGISLNSMSYIVSKNNIEFPEMRREVGGRNNISRIRRARQMNIIRQTYGQQILSLFGDNKAKSPERE